MSERGTRVCAGVGIGAVGLFWIGAITAGLLAPGYSVRNDFISSLAGRGSEVAVLGIANLTVLALAHLAAAAAVRGLLAVPLAVAGAAGLAVAAFRLRCPGGAAGCRFGADDPPDDLADTVHGLGVTAYEVALLVAMVVVVVAGLRGRAPRWFALVTLVAGVASVLLVRQLGGPDTGWWQRGWLVVNTGWLVLLLVRTVREPGAGSG